MHRILLPLLMLSCLFPGCAGTKTLAQKHRTPDAIIAGLRLSNPGALDADVARARMEAEGFECEMVENGTFVLSTNREKGLLPDADFIRCRRELEHRIDDVALVVENGVVTDV